MNGAFTNNGNTNNGKTKKRKTFINYQEDSNVGTVDTINSAYTSVQENGAEYKVIKYNPNKNSNKKTKFTSNEKYLKIQEERKSLPIYDAREALIEEFKNSKTIVVVGETGSGKVCQQISDFLKIFTSN